MMENGKILLSLTGWDPEQWRKALREAAPEREAVLAPAIADDPSIRYAIVWKPPAGSLARLPNLQAIFSAGAGVDHILTDDRLPDVPIVRVVADDLTMRMSEYVVWQVLDHHRMGALYRRQQTRHLWREELRQPAAGQVTVGIMGMGALGGDAARKLSAIGFNVTGWSRRPKQVEGVTC
ncbi:MAG TPA: NAD(P)-dependent oxidoreductase, partial [Pararhizobium sp.]|nr:NAD(P)-dependent oxidoreductase [Pararhizobium sp.]